jgi:hypothetical protein
MAVNYDHLSFSFCVRNLVFPRFLLLLIHRPAFSRSWRATHVCGPAFGTSVHLSDRRWCFFFGGVFGDVAVGPDVAVLQQPCWVCGFGFVGPNQPTQRAGLSSARVILMGGGGEPHTHCGARRRLQLGFLNGLRAQRAALFFLMGFVPGAQRAIFFA